MSGFSSKDSLWKVHISVILFWLLVCVYFSCVLEAEYVLLFFFYCLFFYFNYFNYGYVAMRILASCYELAMALSLPSCVSSINYMTLVSWRAEYSLWLCLAQIFMSLGHYLGAPSIWNYKLSSGRGCQWTVGAINLSRLRGYAWLLGSCAALANRESGSFPTIGFVDNSGCKLYHVWDLASTLWNINRVIVT